MPYRGIEYRRNKELLIVKKKLKLFTSIGRISYTTSLSEFTSLKLFGRRYRINDDYKYFEYIGTCQYNMFKNGDDYYSDNYNKRYGRTNKVMDCGRSERKNKYHDRREFKRIMERYYYERND